MERKTEVQFWGVIYLFRTHKTSGKKRHRNSVSKSEGRDMGTPGSELLGVLQKIVDNPEDVDIVYSRILKDIFHAFHVIPISTTHGLRAAFLRALCDHIMRWDPVARIKVDEVCRRVYGFTFEVMLARSTRYILQRTPRYVSSPNVLVPMIQHIYDVFGNALDAETQLPLFSKNAWQKANAVLELARQGYLSDLPGVPMCEKAGVDEHGLEKWTCRRGTNKVEGGPHGDIYRKFGALHCTYDSGPSFMSSRKFECHLPGLEI
jgi:hypothetical protein